MDWFKILRETCEEVKRNVKLTLSLKEAGEELGQGAGGDITRKVDYIAEKTVIETLNKLNVSCILVSEEAGVKKLGEKPKEFIILDPIDGTLNALRGINFYCCSLAVSKTLFLKSVYAGLVMDLVNGDVYYAEKDKGAYLNNNEVHTSNVTSLNKALIGLDLCFTNSEDIKKIANLFNYARHTRHFGANALELCQIANNVTDAFIDARNKIRAVDIAASQLIVKEAGGVIVSLNGEELNMKVTPEEKASFIAAANNHLCKEILRVLKTV
ncbi:fructose 1,6-bisphosphatase [Candidatus Bathyarchaeota archaeon]|nr:fructose 1,6-bisphosphatase [Candidatus Bathyarchaeota archaeon]